MCTADMLQHGYTLWLQNGLMKDVMDNETDGVKTGDRQKCDMQTVMLTNI